MSATHRLLGCKGCGSAIVEAAFAVAGMPLEYEQVDYGVPPKGDPGRLAFLRWSTFLVAAVYPTFSFGDEPAKWVEDVKGAKQLRESTDRHREAQWLRLEEIAGDPWFLGAQMCALDLYVAVMTRWRPWRRPCAS